MSAETAAADGGKLCGGLVARVRVIGGPWKERIGCTGQVVGGPDTYPWCGLPKHEVVVLLDDDPLSCDHHRGGCDHEPGSFTCTRREPPWTCCISRKHLERLDG